MDLLDMITEGIVELDEEKVIKIVKRAIVAEIPKIDIIAALSEGLDKVGEKYSKGEYVMYDLMMSGILYEEVMSLEELSLAENLKSEEKKGLMVIGTIEGDVHDIGKSIFKNAVSMSGFDVIDLGVDVPPEVFVQAIEEHAPDIVGISIIMTEAINNAKRTVEKIREKVGADLDIIIGGVATNLKIAQFIGADAYSNNVLNGVNICLRMVDGDGKKY